MPPQDNIPEETIPGFRLASQRARPTDSCGFRFDGTDDQPNPNKTDSCNHSPSVQPSSPSRRSAAYDRISADRLGYELAPDAAIWELYVEEADEHDQELVKGRNANLDMLLLFSSPRIYSNKTLMKSANLFVMMAQSQQRMELGLPPPPGLNSAIQIPEFKPSSASLWINGIWFISLGISLSAAVIAMLSKEWLAAFLALRPRAAHDYALNCQARLEGLERWWALHIITLLPSMLHMALLLFSVGLVIYLGTLDIIIAAVFAGIVGVTLLFYAVTTVLGASLDFCPFVTEMSGYLRRFRALLSIQHDQKKGPGVIGSTLQDLQALLWLSENSRDPAVVDCCYQALAGLRRPSSIPSTGTKPELLNNKVFETPMQLTKDTSICTLLSTTVERFQQLESSSVWLYSRPEASEVRYLSAIVALSMGARQFWGNGSTPPALGTTASGPPASPGELWNIASTLWSSEGPILGADTYAWLLVIEIDILRLAIAEVTSNSITNGNPTASHANAPTPHVPHNQGAYAINLVVLQPSSGQTMGTNELLCNYDRWLARVSALMRFHSEERITISSRPLQALLTSLVSATSLEFFSTRGRSFNQTSLTNAPPIEIRRIIVPLNHDQSFSMSPGDLGSGPLGSLVELLSMYCRSKDDQDVKICLTVLRAYSLLAPRLLHQAFDLRLKDLQDSFNTENWTPEESLGWSGFRYTAVRLGLMTIRYIGLARTAALPHWKFCERVLWLLCYCSRERCIRGGRTVTGSRLIADYSSDLVPLLEFAAEFKGKLGQVVPYHVIYAMLEICHGYGLRYEDAPCCKSFTPPCFPVIIRMIGCIKFHKGVIQDIFAVMLRRMRLDGPGHKVDNTSQRKPSLAYLQCFTLSAEGMSAFACSVAHTEHREDVADAIIAVVHLALGQDQELTVSPVQLATPAVPGFLAAVSAVLKVKKNDDIPASFARDVVNLLSVAADDNASGEIIANYSGLGEMLEKLLGLVSQTEKQALMCAIELAKEKFKSGTSELGE